MGMAGSAQKKKEDETKGALAEIRKGVNKALDNVADIMKTGTKRSGLPRVVATKNVDYTKIVTNDAMDAAGQIVEEIQGIAYHNLNIKSVPKRRS